MACELDCPDVAPPQGIEAVGELGAQRAYHMWDLGPGMARRRLVCFVESGRMSPGSVAVCRWLHWNSEKDCGLHSTALES